MDLHSSLPRACSVAGSAGLSEAHPYPHGYVCHVDTDWKNLFQWNSEVVTVPLGERKGLSYLLLLGYRPIKPGTMQVARAVVLPIQAEGGREMEAVSFQFFGQNLNSAPYPRHFRDKILPLKKGGPREHVFVAYCLLRGYLSFLESLDLMHGAKPGSLKALLTTDWVPRDIGSRCYTAPTKPLSDREVSNLTHRLGEMSGSGITPRLESYKGFSSYIDDDIGLFFSWAEESPEPTAVQDLPVAIPTSIQGPIGFLLSEQRAQSMFLAAAGTCRPSNFEAYRLYKLIALSIADPAVDLTNSISVEWYRNQFYPGCTELARIRFSLELNPSFRDPARMGHASEPFERLATAVRYRRLLSIVSDDTIYLDMVVPHVEFHRTKVRGIPSSINWMGMLEVFLKHEHT